MQVLKRIKDIGKDMLPEQAVSYFRGFMLQDALKCLSRKEKEQYRQEIEYMLSCGRARQLPYAFSDAYDKAKVDVLRDEEGFPFVKDESGYNLYFPKDRTDSAVTELYRALLAEQDPESPHCYFDDRHRADGEVFLDIGAAEGLISLRQIMYAERVFLFENDSAWFRPLEKTFAPFGDKAVIIKGTVGNTGEGDVIGSCIEEFGLSEKDLFIKMDIEGMEPEVLRSAESNIARPGVKLSVCAYHSAEDERVISEYLLNLGFSVRSTPGHMFVLSGINRREFRKGVIYAVYEKNPRKEETV